MNANQNAAAVEAIVPFVDPEIESLLSVLNDTGAAVPSLEEVIEANAPVIDSGDIIEARVEVLSIEGADESVVHSDEAVSAAIAALDVNTHYAAVPGDQPALEGADAEELAAANTERLLAEENLVVDAEGTGEDATTTAVAAKPAKAKTARVHYANKTDRIKARLGAKLGDFMVLELDDADLEGDALKAKQDETLAVIDAMSVKVKNRASLLLDWVSGKTAKPNEIMKRALDCLATDGKLTTGDKGNLHINLLSKPYSAAAARSMGRNTLTVMEKLKMISLSTKGEYLPNDDSMFLMLANSKMALPEVGAAAAEEEPAE